MPQPSSRSKAGARDVSEGSFLSSAGGTFFLPGIIDNVIGTVRFSGIAAGTSPLSLSNVILLDAALGDARRCSMTSLKSLLSASVLVLAAVASSSAQTPPAPPRLRQPVRAKAVPPKQREEGVWPDRCEGGPPPHTRNDGPSRAFPGFSWSPPPAHPELALCELCARLSTRGPGGCSERTAGV